MANKNKTDGTHEVRVDIMDEDNEEVITLTDDEGNDVDFYQVACVEYDHEFFALLQPAVEVEGVPDDEGWIFKIIEEEDGENDLFVPVEDPELLQKVFEEYVKATAT